MNKLAKTELILAKTGSDNISLSEAGSNELVSYFLRDVRGRSDLAEAVRQNSKDHTFNSHLENIRTLIDSEKFDAAKSIIDNCVPSNQQEQAELLLEQARYFFFTNEYKTCVSILEKVINNRDALTTTKMTSLELLGQSFYCLDDKESAINYLKKATNQLDFFPYAISGFVAGAHLVKIFSELNNFSQAKITLDFLENKLTQLSGDEIWLSRQLLILRAKVHYYKNQNQIDETFKFLCEAHTIAKWLEDKDMVQRCNSDLQTLGLKLPAHKNINYLTNSQALLVTAPKYFSRYDTSPVLAKMIQNLIGGPTTSEELFQVTYGYSFDKERHGNHLRATLSKLRKKLPANFLNIKNGKIHLAASQEN